MNEDRKSKIIHRIEQRVGIPNLSNILADKLTPTDLQSLLLSVYQKRVLRRNPRNVLLDYQTNKFKVPSQTSPLLLLEWDRTAFSHLPDEYKPIELSPVGPFGSVSSVAPISQDWILTTVRNLELISDTTNILALECAVRRQKFLQIKNTKAAEVHLACSHRVVRSQRYESSNLLQHFRLFSLCSAGRTMGDLRFELKSISTYIQFYVNSIRSFLGNDVAFQVVLLDISPDSQNTTMLSDFITTLNTQVENVKVHSEIEPKEKKDYYQNIRFRIYCNQNNGQEVELVDGGAVDWTQKFLNNAKERLVISGIGSERLCEMQTNNYISNSI